MNFTRLRTPLILLTVGWLGAFSVSAQWMTQSNLLKSGWNAIYLTVDPSKDTVDAVLSSAPDIEEVWLWNTPSLGQQFVDSPTVPSGGGAGWTQWTRNLGPDSPLKRLIPNAAYYVKLADSTPSFTWNIKGRPIAPSYRWLSSGLNFIGFQVPQPVTYEMFFGPTPSLLQNSEIYRSDGGPFGDSNPIRVFDFARTSIRPGEAVWMRVDGTYNRYFGPFEVTLQKVNGVSFGDRETQLSLRLRNQTAETNVVRLSLLASELPPVGQPVIIGVPPLVVRGPVDPSTLTYAAIPLREIGLDSQYLSAPTEWSLAPAGQPGSDVEVVIGLARNQISSPPGTQLAGVLRFTDGKGLLQVNLPISAVAQSTAGLWVGDASVTSVAQSLKDYLKGADGTPILGKRWISTTVGLFTGSAANEGLDFAGNFVDALTFGTGTPSIGDADFSSVSTLPPGTVQSDQVSTNWAAPLFGPSQSATALSQVLTSALFSPTSKQIQVQLPVLKEVRYRLQLAFVENGTNSPHRGFDVSINGKMVVPNLVPADYVETQGSYAEQVRRSGVVLRYEFTAIDTTLSIVLNGNTVTSSGIQDSTPFLNALTLEQLDASTLPPELKNPEGAYIASSTNQAMGVVAKSFNLRLILHDTGTNASLLQRVFYGRDSQTNLVLTTQETFLDASQLSSARRISCIHFPWTVSNTPWPLTSDGASLTAVISTPYDAKESNPFIHQYHPDHDNLDSSFRQVLPKGQESFGIVRTVRLTPQESGEDFESLTTASQQRRGIFEDSVTLEGAVGQTRTFRSRGTYLLNRISPISTLTTP